MQRHFHRLPGVQFVRPLVLGSIRFLSAESLRAELRDALDREPTTSAMEVAHAVVREQLEAWGEDAAVEVICDEVQDPHHLALDATAVLRFFARS
jgi:hypothetical protein